MKTALLAGTQSGCGKTMMMLALLQYLKSQHGQVLLFKSEPDFLDPLWHQVITGQASYNVDTHMLGTQLSKALVSCLQTDRGDQGVRYQQLMCIGILPVRQK